jgi:hypothetical protein
MPCFRSSSACIIALTLAVLWLGAAPTRAFAGLVLTVESSSAPVGGAGSFDVLLSDTGGSFQIAGFSVELAVATSSGVEFTAANTNTTMDPYIFGTLQSPPFYFNTFPIQDFIASDFLLSLPGYVTLTAGEVVGLEHVTYSVAAGTAPGPVSVTIQNIGAGTSLADVNGGLISFTPTNGTITVTPASVPEPSSIVAWALGIVCVLLGLIRQKLLGGRGSCSRGEFDARQVSALSAQINS